MGTGFRGTYAIAWVQTRLDGVPPGARDEIEDGTNWRWSGEALALDGASGRLLLASSPEEDALRDKAAAAARRMMQMPDRSAAERAADGADPVLRAGFVVSDGQAFWDVVPVALERGADPVLIFPGRIPPRDSDLTVIRGAAVPGRADPVPDGAVLCFTPGTRLRTEAGDIAVEDLEPGARVLTRDDGPQAVAWTGARRMSGARLFAMPDQRPVRIRAGALGVDRPEPDLVISPDHRVVLRGPAPHDLWGEAEVLVRAGDLVGDRNVVVDGSLRQTRYIHLLMERHQVVWANGVETESFLPDPAEIAALDAEQRDSLLAAMPSLAAPGGQPPARRMLSRAEAAICLSGPLARGCGPRRRPH